MPPESLSQPNKTFRVLGLEVWTAGFTPSLGVMIFFTGVLQEIFVLRLLSSRVCKTGSLFGRHHILWFSDFASLLRRVG